VASLRDSGQRIRQTADVLIPIRDISVGRRKRMPDWAAVPATQPQRTLTDRMNQHTGEKDLVLIHFEEKPLCFARIESIEADHKPGWYHVTLLLLQVPVQTATWILRDAYIDGAPFTMNGKQMRLEKIVSPLPQAPAGAAPTPDTAPAKEPDGAKVISFDKLRKDK
jgi:hypothetical protein